MTNQRLSPSIIGQEYITEHPNGYIRLMDNSLLKVYETKEPHKGFEKGQDSKVFEFFQEHIPLFWKHRNLILSDSRMFLSPIPSVVSFYNFRNSSNPTLGIYLELWGICKYATKQEDNGLLSFVTNVSGNPLSGSNRCTLVNEKGQIIQGVSIDSYSTVGRELYKLIERYKDLDKTYETFSLEEIVKRLQTPQDEPKEVNIVLSTANRYDAFEIESKYKSLLSKYEYLENSHSQAVDLLHRYVVEANREELTKKYKEHINLQKEWTKREKELKEERANIRYRLRHLEPNSRELQLRLKAISKEETEWSLRLGAEYAYQIRKIFKEFPLHVSSLGKLLGLE